MKALEGLNAKASENKNAFDAKLKAHSLQVYNVGDSVKLRNESHTKGQPRWFGPFEIKSVLENNVYILINPAGDNYIRPVNGNHLRPISSRSVITNEMWATPPVILQTKKRREDKIQKDLTKKAKALSKVMPPSPT
ncbi:hypothetical protein Pst134EA_025546 [Puccinia striiformis f. sp. tritici]|uniref:hypothetical protein n=1 Tax=Puccinia striiformis f. sp. tritici TaxID=168172 RepID=UPI0020089819|nr:hypothetical protein Pst134EA_025546 [Puccinia striiformis f. sp. tritici]KAH9451599.1 hypothetical protein Pst134EA_025546 [Puccinia striiformis f. sp. tritici]